LVAQLYQRGFARRTRNRWQAMVLNRATGEQQLRNIRDIFKQRDWNTIVDPDGTKDFTVERVLAERIDAPAAAALKAVRGEHLPLAPEHRHALALFMAAQLARGRTVRENLMEFVADTTRLMLRVAAANYTDEHWLQAIGEVPSAAARRRIANSENHFDIKPTNALLLQTLLSNIDDIAELLAKRTWTLVRFREPCLLTGEEPVVHINPSGETIGYGVVTAERMYMPVSTTHGLVLSHPWTSWPEDLVSGKDELAQQLNWAVIVHPNNRELLLHPDIERHPIPAAGLLATGGMWPWGEDLESKPPVFMEYLATPARLADAA
jgi:hypothetical protein